MAYHPSLILDISN